MICYLTALNRNISIPLSYRQITLQDELAGNGVQPQIRR